MFEEISLDSSEFTYRFNETFRLWIIKFNISPDIV